MVDASSYAGNVLSAIANPKTYSLGDVYEQANKGMQFLDAQAKREAGQALQAATDPQTGVVDYQKAQSLAAGNPRAALAMRQLLLDASKLKGEAQTQGLERNSAVSNAIIGALNGDDAGLHDRVLSGLNGLVSTGAMTRDQATAAALALPNDPTQMRQRLEQLRISVAPPALQQQGIYGAKGTQTGPGGVTIGTSQDVRSGAVSVPPQSGAPQGVSPGEALGYQQWLKAPRDYPDPANPTVTKHGTNETYLRDSGMPDQYIYTGGAPAQPGTQPPASPLGTGRLPPALQNPNKPQTAPPPAPAPPPASSPAGAAISGPTPEQTAAAEATKQKGIISPAKFQQEADAGTQAQNQQAILGNMLADTSQFTTGPLAGITGKARNWANALGLKVDTEAQSAKESFDKLAAGLADAQGAGSDERMRVNIAANPHEELSPQGVDMILRQLQGNADYTRAKASLAAKYPNQADHPAFLDSIKGLDPRVFQLQRMTQEQRSTYMKSLDSEAKKQINTAIDYVNDLKKQGKL